MTGQDWLNVLLWPSMVLVLAGAVLLYSRWTERRWRSDVEADADAKHPTVEDLDRRLTALEATASHRQAHKTAAE
jgi:hypothetical protein